MEQATLNALRVVDLLNRGDVPVARGLANPLVRDAVRATSFHGKDGLGDSNLPLSKIRPIERNALDAISDELAASKYHELTIICTGPLTNIAALMTSFPDTAKMIRELVIMGGAYGVTEYGVGNVTPVAEFNIYADPENIRKHGIFALHDPMTVASKVKPSIFEFVDYKVHVETKGELTAGMTVVDRREKLAETKMQGEKIMICKNVDSRGFKRLFLDRLTRA